MQGKSSNRCASWLTFIFLELEHSQLVSSHYINNILVLDIKCNILYHIMYHTKYGLLVLIVQFLYTKLPLKL